MSDVVTRDNYYDRQFLRPEDFTDEQAYHVAMRRDHNIAAHSWGIIEGLAIKVTNGTPYVLPGVAIDGYGRELILTDLKPVPVQRFAQTGQDLLDVWLYYELVSSESAPAGYTGCGTTGSQFYRWVEQPVVRLLPPGADDPPGRRAPPEVPDADIDFPPSRLPPDDPARPWPVFLGQLREDRSGPQRVYVPDETGRPYAGLVGEQVTAPSGRARLQIGAEQDKDTRRFAVWVPADDPGEPRLQIDDKGEVEVRGKLNVDGDVTVDGAVELGVGPAQTGPTPWSISYVKPPKGEEPPVEQAKPAKVEEPRIELDQSAKGEELRIELPAPAVGPAAQVVVGHWDADANKFQPCLSVSADCTVKVAGDLVVDGSVTMSGELIAPQLGPEATRVALSSFLTGVGGVSTLLDRLSPSPVTAEPTSDVELRRIARDLAGNPGRRAAFAALVKEAHPELAGQLSVDLRPERGES